MISRIQRRYVSPSDEQEKATLIFVSGVEAYPRAVRLLEALGADPSAGPQHLSVAEDAKGSWTIRGVWDTGPTAPASVM